jgi:uncharacterized protein with NRDE domain
MCTLSVIRRQDGAVRVVMNRDESVDRARACSPEWRDVGGGARAIWPTDPAGSGTWICATTRGLILVMMNSSAGERLTGRTSRGVIVTRCAGDASVREVAGRVRAMELREFNPFRMVAIGAHDGRCTTLAWDGQSVREHDPPLPVCLASSGLGDELVQVRVALFERMMNEVGEGSDRAEVQDAFHAHTWPDRPHLSVMMSRPGFRTVSVTCVAMSPGTGGVWDARMDYRPVGELFGVRN